MPDNIFEDEQELFQLTNGQYIMDAELSRKMYVIKDAQPECSHQISGTGYSWDEAGMADLFAECYKNDTRFCPETKCWYTYSDGKWNKDTGSLLVAEKIKEFYRLMALYCGEIGNDDRRQSYMKFIAKMGDRRFRDRLMKDAAASMPIAAEQFDANPYLINCKNGTYDLNEGVFREHDWRDFLTMQTNFDYTTQDTSCERWVQFVDEVTCGDKEKARYLQKALGYSMLGMANEECMFILHGKTTRNGKSTMLSAIHHLLGDYAYVAPVSLICKSDKAKNAEAASPVKASLKGKRFVTMAESNQYGKIDEEELKRYTGGEEITARQLYEKPISFLPQFTLWLSCNDLPSVNDKSLFASERIKVIEFNRHFSAAEQDKNLKTEFQTTKTMQGIFTWLVEGLFYYKRDGLMMPGHLKTVVEEYEKNNDLVLQFLEEKCERCEGEYARSKTLYDAYKIWCKSNGYFACSAKRFHADLQTHVEWHEGRVVLHGNQVYKGLKLKGV